MELKLKTGPKNDGIVCGTLYDTEYMACLPFSSADQLMTSEQAKSEQLPNLVESPDIQPSEHETKVKLRSVFPSVYSACLLCRLHLMCVIQVRE